MFSSYPGAKFLIDPFALASKQNGRPFGRPSIIVSSRFAYPWTRPIDNHTMVVDVMAIVSPTSNN